MIALITDFGVADCYAGVMKGVMKSINQRADIIDITHSVPSYSIINAQFALYSSYHYFPAGTIFAVIVDPGVGTARKGIIAQDDRYYFVLPDNGIISAVASSRLKIFSIDMTLFPEASSTFHARDVFGPVAARLSLGYQPGQLGSLTNDAVLCPFPDYTLAESGYSATIIHIDKFGNAITSLPNDTIDFNSIITYTVISDNYRFDTVCAGTYGDIALNNSGMIRGSSGFIELAANQFPISEKFNMTIGDHIVIKRN